MKMGKHSKEYYNRADAWCNENKDRLIEEYNKTKPYGDDPHGLTKYIYYKTEEAMRKLAEVKP